MNEGTLFDFYKCTRTYIVNTVTAHGLKYLSATPTFYRLLAPYDFVWTSIEGITFNGEKSTQILIDQMRRCCPHARIRNIYGSSESGPLISSDSEIFTLPERLVGKVKVQDGELMLHNSLVSKSTNVQGWYPTGDLVEVRSNDPLTFSFVSRKSRIINVAGQNVNPQEIEEVLLSHPDIIDAQVLPKPNALIGNVITAAIISNNKMMTEKEILTYLASKIAKYKIPRIIKFVDDISIGRTGKKSIKLT
jgi:acyl-coenzyme A synthetase/AMP-(fatty) acid ligase